MSCGVCALFGWIFEIRFLKGVLPNLSTMKANTACAFILSGASLLFWLQECGRAGRRIAQFSGLTVALIGAITLVEYIFGVDLRIDQLLFEDPSTSALTSYPGRMGINTALAFVLGTAGWTMRITDVVRPSRQFATLLRTQ